MAEKKSSDHAHEKHEEDFRLFVRVRSHKERTETSDSSFTDHREFEIKTTRKGMVDLMEKITCTALDAPGVERRL